MSDTIWAFVIVAAAVVLIVVLLRHRLSEFRFKISRSDLDATLQNERATSSVSHNLQAGRDNDLAVVTKDADVIGNRQLGKGNKMQVRS